MSNRLTRSEYLVTYMIIITLACFVGGFFLGAGVMKARIQSDLQASAKAEQEALEKERLLKEQKLYRDQDFIRYYYSITVHIQELKDKHFSTAAQFSGKTKSEQKALIKELQELAQTTRKELEGANIASTSQLLVDSKYAYINSLDAYRAGLDQLLEKLSLGSLTPDDLLMMRNQTGFINQWNAATALQYQAMATWEAVYVTKQQAVPKVQPAQVSPAQWKAYPYHMRNFLAAEALVKSQQFYPFYPEDLTARIDSVLQGETATTFGWKDIDQAARMLEATDAVRLGDFQSMRSQLYPDLKAPEIPTFSK
ncbi:UNVERIFIED_CONTAM: hypothetical protein ABID98_002127 [Brevibacillus sp. OAP136]